jgi:general secretion pathway protein G
MTMEMMRMRLVKRRQRAGVTLVEVLIVVAIMAMLAGGVAFAVLPRMHKARIDTAKQGALAIRKAVQVWQTDNGSDCPTVSQMKKDGVLDRAGASEDPWGKAFKISCVDNEIYVASSGPDQKSGTQDDITVPSEAPEGEPQ